MDDKDLKLTDDDITNIIMVLDNHIDSLSNILDCLPFSKRKFIEDTICHINNLVKKLEYLMDF